MISVVYVVSADGGLKPRPCSRGEQHCWFALLTTPLHPLILLVASLASDETAAPLRILVLFSRIRLAVGTELMVNINVYLDQYTHVLGRNVIHTKCGTAVATLTTLSSS